MKIKLNPKKKEYWLINTRKKEEERSKRRKRMDGRKEGWADRRKQQDKLHMCCAQPVEWLSVSFSKRSFGILQSLTHASTSRSKEDRMCTVRTVFHSLCVESTFKPLMAYDVPLEWVIVALELHASPHKKKTSTVKCGQGWCTMMEHCPISFLFSPKII